MAFKRRSGGAWTDVAAIKRRSGGAWVTCANVYRRTGGVWVKVWPSLSASIVGGFVSALGGTPGGATARYGLTNAGIEYKKEGTAAQVNLGTWLLAGAAADYDVMATVTGGDTSPTGPVGSWVNLGTSREWTVVGAVGDVNTAVMTVEIRPAGGGATLDSASVTLEGEQF